MPVILLLTTCSERLFFNKSIECYCEVIYVRWYFIFLWCFCLLLTHWLDGLLVFNTHFAMLRSWLLSAVAVVTAITHSFDCCCCYSLCVQKRAFILISPSTIHNKQTTSEQAREWRRSSDKLVTWNKCFNIFLCYNVNDTTGCK